MDDDSPLAVESIDFNLPSGDGKSIFIQNIHWKHSSEELKFALEDRYRRFGLIHSIVVSRSSGRTYKAYVNYYSSFCASEAISSSSNESLSKGRGLARSRPLNSGECIQLANHYFGFNGWSYKILYHRPETILSPDESSALHWVCVMLVLVGDLQVEGVSKLPLETTTPEDPSGKGSAYGRAQRSVARAALGNALRKLLILVIRDPSEETTSPTYKVKVQVNTAVKDPFFYDPLWESTNLEDSKFSTLNEDE